MTSRTPRPVFFRSPAQFRRWLRAHHADTPELLVGFHKKDSGKGGLTYPEALEEALCFGWIDGVRRSLGPGAYVQRFTPRKPKSYWSAVNIRRMKELIAAGRAAKPGLTAFARRDEKAAARYSFERATAAFSPAEEKAFRAQAKAWTHFQSRPPGYRRVATFFVVSAKKPETRARRLATLIELCRRGESLPMLGRPKRA